jgi:putative Mg2+ transporter-C (MgtC) family protein
MEIIWRELTNGIPDAAQLARVLIRLIAATVFGALIGYQRESAGKPAGLRTHTLVSVGTCLFVVGGDAGGLSFEGQSRVIQGIITGIGFIGAGTILKLQQERDIQGLTTASGVWMTAAIGVAVGLGNVGLGLIATVLALLLLAFAGRLEYRANLKSAGSGVLKDKA